MITSQGVPVPYTLEPVQKSDDCVYCNGQVASPWTGIFSNIYCINLKSRPDRRALAEQELHRTGLCVGSTMYLSDSVDKSINANGYGCFMSHKQLCMQSMEKGEKCILVFEDDFVFKKSPADELAQIVKEALAQIPTGWRRLQIGYNPFVSLPVSSRINRSASILTHAQIWSTEGIQYMAESNFRGVYHDFQLAISMGGSYDIQPMICYQRILGSDNTGSISERLFLNEDAMANSVWTIPLMITIGFLIVFGLLGFVLWKSMKWTKTKSAAVAALILGLVAAAIIIYVLAM